jgi:hypothetical protein
MDYTSTGRSTGTKKAIRIRETKLKYLNDYMSGGRGTINMFIK